MFAPSAAERTYTYSKDRKYRSNAVEFRGKLLKLLYTNKVIIKFDFKNVRNFFIVFFSLCFFFFFYLDYKPHIWCVLISP